MKQIVNLPDSVDQLSGSTLAATPTLCHSSTAIALHWAIAALVLTTVPLGVYGANAAGDLARLAKDIHKPLGIGILALTLVRVGWRLAHTPPALPVTILPALRRVARGTHVAFYLLLVALPLSGWWLSSAVPVRHAISLILFDVPFLPVPHNRVDRRGASRPRRAWLHDDWSRRTPYRGGAQAPFPRRRRYPDTNASHRPLAARRPLLLL